ncbi:MAG: four helix bundle protein [Patescibacteria group bacterium]|nr:four helix bundle protein [Patescibacteria group bacterium]
MSRYLHLPIFQKAYDLNLEIYRTTHNFPREYKYTLGQNIKEIAGNLLDSIVAANSEENKGRYFPLLKTQVEQLRIKIRLSYDLKIINSRRLEFLNRLIEEISKQISGWEKWFLKNFSEARIFAPSATAESEKRAF